MKKDNFLIGLIISIIVSFIAIFACTLIPAEETMYYVYPSKSEYVEISRKVTLYRYEKAIAENEKIIAENEKIIEKYSTILNAIEK